jgi:predicted ATP-binding protein involved in virulence
MKIAKVKWKDHPILGNLELDFINKSIGEPYDNILFVGENDSGKTTIFESLNTFLCDGPFEYFDRIEYQIDDGQFLIAVPPRDGYDGTCYDIIDEKKQRIEMHSGKNKHGGSGIDSAIDNDKRNIKLYGCVFSSTRSNFKTEKILGTGTSQLDKNKKDKDKDKDIDTVKDKQLLIDISVEDNLDYTNINKNNQTSLEDFKPKSKMYRFEVAFNNFFKDVWLSFEGIDKKAKEYDVYFKKHNNTISIDKLSTGEKQIVFRGTRLLKNITNLYDGTVFIDEPELSMHPKWAEKILSYYQGLFSYEGKQQFQMFFCYAFGICFKRSFVR